MALTPAIKILWIGEGSEVGQLEASASTDSVVNSYNHYLQFPPPSHWSLDSTELAIEPFTEANEALTYLMAGNSAAGIVLDLVFPHDQGLDPFWYLQAQAPQLPIIVLLSPSHGALGLAAVGAGADAYLIKGQATFDDIARAMLCAIEQCRRLTGSPRPGEQNEVDNATFGDRVTASPIVARLARQEQLYRSIFQGVPVSIWEEDWSAVIALINGLRAQGVPDFARYLDEHPEFVQQALRQVKILDVNAATLELFQAQTKADILSSLAIVFSTPETLSGFKQELLALFRGDTVLNSEMKLRTLTGKLIDVLLSMTLPSPSSSSGLVLVSLMDVTPLKQTQTQLTNRVRQQEAVAQLGLAAVGAHQLQPVLQQATEQVAAVLGMNFSKVLALAEDGSYFRLVAGTGWAPGLVGTATVGCDRTSQAGFTLQFSAPVYVNDLSQESRFTPPPLLVDHGIVSGMSVVIQVLGQPWGVLAVHHDQYHPFSQDDTYFLQSVASLLALFIERLETQTALQESHRQMQEAQRIAALCSWEYDFASDRMHWAEPCFEVTGIDQADFVPTYEGCLRYVHPEDQERAQSLVEQAMRDRTPIDFEHRWIAPNGTVRYMHERGQIVYNSEGQPQRMLGTFQDITARRQAEDRLRQQATLLSNAERIGHMGSWDMDLINDQLIWSQGTYRLFGITPEELQGGLSVFLNLVLPEDRPQLLRAHRASDHSTTGILDVEYRIRRPDGVIRWLYERGHVEFDQTGTAVRRLGMVMDITEQKNAETALRQSEERFRQLFRDAATGIAVTTLDGRFLEANTAYCQMVGYSPAELQQLDFTTLTHRDDRPQNQVLTQALLKGQRDSFIIEKRYLAKSGAIIWCRLSVSLQRDAVGQPVSMIGVAEDITQQRQAEVALQRSQALLRVACDISGTGAWWVDLPEQTLTWSDKMYDILEWPQEQTPEVAAVIQCYVPGDREQLVAAFKACIHTGTSYDLSLRVTTAQGNLRWTRSIGEAVRDASGQIVRVQGAFQDISAQKTAEQELRSSEERFRLLSKATNDAIWDWDITTNTNWRGEGFTTFFGYQPDDMMLTHEWWQARIHPDDRPQVLASLRQALAHGASSWSGEYRFCCQDGSYANVFDRGYIMRHADGQPVRMIGGMMNITQQKNLEAQLQQSQKMEAVGQLAGGIAHDFNNLLTIILGCGEMLLTMVPKGDPLRAIANDIYTAGDRASDLTRQLLAFSRKQILSPQILDLNQVVSNLEKLLRRLISEDIQLRTQLATSLPQIEVDPGQLEQVILNLTLNARDAMPQGGELMIETAAMTIGPDESLGKLDCAPGHYVMLAISDSGHGMTTEIKDRIFEPFFTTKDPGQGTGLGLATVFGIVKQSNGLIDVYSEPGLGTCFKLLFPAVSVMATATAAETAPVQPGHETILLVEDEVGVRQIAKRALEQLGYQVLEAANGKAALDVMQAYAQPIHLVITDVVMPEMSGRQLVEQLDRQGESVQVLYMSGYTDDAIVRHGVSEEVNAFLQKPFTPSGLARKVREVLDKQGLG